MEEKFYEKYKNNSKGLETYLESLGYKRLGWQVHTGNCKELKECFDLGHMKRQERKVFDIQHTRTGGDCTYWCEECKNYWKIDMSD